MTITQTKDFTELLDEYDYERPQRGQFIQAEILQIDPDQILVDLGGKQDAVVSRDELKRTSEQILEGITPGDFIPVLVTHEPSARYRAQVSICRGIEQQDWDAAEKLLESEEIIEVEITGYNKGGLLARFGRLDAFIPTSLVPSLRRIASQELTLQRKKEMIGKTIPVKVIEVKPRRHRLILSAAAAQSKARANRFAELEVGQTVKGTVVNVVDFGAFVDIGSIDGLIHISEMSWQEVEDVHEVLSMGDVVETRVIEVDPERERISLSLKALQPYDWAQAGDLVQTVTCES